MRLTLELKLGSEFSLIAKMLPQPKNNKVGEEDGQGIYKLNVIGTIKSPRIKSNSRNSSRRPSRVNRPETKDIEKNDRDIDTKSPEERRRERRERIEARKRAQEARKRAGGVDLPDRPVRDLPNRPLSRVPALDRDEDIDEDDDIIEPGDDIIEPGDEEDDGDFDPGQDEDEDINDDEPSDEEE